MRIDLAHHLGDPLEEGAGLVRPRVRGHDHPTRRLLGEGHVGLGGRGSLERATSHVPDDPDDLAPRALVGLVVAPVNPSTNGVFAREKAVHHRLTHDDDEAPFGPIFGRDGAASEHGDA